MFATKASKNTFVYPLIGFGLYAVLSKTEQKITIRRDDIGLIIKTYSKDNGIDQEYFENITFEQFVEDAKEMYLQLICKN
jgi:hypothetical protein